MKSILLLRHAKSSWNNPALDDHERPLNKRGFGDAPRMGQLIADEGLKPDLIISSTACRAKTTAEIVSQECGLENCVEFTDDLYLAPPSNYLLILSGLPESADSVLLVGHNPGISDLLMQMSGEGHDMPTAALAHLQSGHETWGEFAHSSNAELVQFWRPKELPQL